MCTHNLCFCGEMRKTSITFCFLFFFYEKCSLSGILLKYCMKVTKHEWSSSFSLKMWPYSGSFVGEWYML